MTLLFSVTLKIALLTLVGLAATATLHRRSAAMRHWVLATTMFCCVSVPAAELLLPSWSIPVPAGWLTPSVTSSLVWSSESPARRATAQGVAVDPSNNVQANTAISPAPMLGGIWLGGALAGLVMMAVGLLRLRTLAAKSEAVSVGPWRVIADDVATLYGIRRHVRLLKCSHPTLLATWGLVRPTILLPDGADTWAEDRIRVVLRHELAHIVRGDWAVSLTADLLKAAYWFNPLLWIACRRLRHEGERACDDFVLASGVSASEYATHLLDVARESARRRHPWSPAIAIAHRSMLEGRVRAMLNARLNREPLTPLTRATTFAAIAVVALSLGVATLSGSTGRAVAPHVRAIQPPSQSATPAVQTQARGGTIEGVLYDQFGGLLPGASVRLTPVTGGNPQTASTNRGGAFSFSSLAAGDYELVTDLPGFIAVKVIVRAEPGQTVRRHIALPIGTLDETIQVVCSATALSAGRPSAPAGSATPGASQRQAPGARGAEPKLPATFTGGIGGQIKVPMKVSHTNPICPTGVTPESTVVRLAGRIGIDGLFTDLHEVSNVPAPFAASAMDATRQWAFTPTLLNGAPIEVNINVTISYSWN
jgi:beta-lactamase regulating signal transducer with metallopeptidase domain